MTQILNSIEKVREFAQKVKQKPIKDSDLIWLFCYWTASTMLDTMTTKDLAYAVRDGLEKLATIDDAKKVLFEDVFGCSTEAEMIEMATDDPEAAEEISNMFADFIKTFYRK